MISDDDAKELINQWRRMGADERTEVCNRLSRVRERVGVVRDQLGEIFCGPFSVWFENPEGLAQSIAESFLGTDGIDGSQHLLELRCLDNLLKPETLAFEYASACLYRALDDEKVSASPIVSQILDDALWRIDRFADEPGGAFDGIYDDVERQAASAAISAKQSAVAKAKNAAPREWVRAEWAKESANGVTKAAFSREYAHHVRSKFRVNVTAETIARDWLPKQS